jgi:hypothetical protein
MWKIWLSLFFIFVLTSGGVSRATEVRDDLVEPKPYAELEGRSKQEVTEDPQLSDFVGRWAESSPGNCTDPNYQGGFRGRILAHHLQFTFHDVRGRIERTQTVNSIVQSKVDAQTTSSMISGVDVEERGKKSATVFYTVDYSQGTLKVNSFVENGILIVTNGVVIEKKDTGELPFELKRGAMPMYFRCDD